jgi:hypothetical protein
LFSQESPFLKHSFRPPLVHLGFHTQTQKGDFQHKDPTVGFQSDYPADVSLQRPAHQPYYISDRRHPALLYQPPLLQHGGNRPEFLTELFRIGGP